MSAASATGSTSSPTTSPTRSPCGSSAKDWPNGSSPPTARIFEDNKQTLEVRVRRLETDFAWAEQPPSRTRHYVTNVLVDAGEQDGEYEVSSYCLIYRSRGDSIEPNLVSVFRKDLVRKTADGYEIARRWAAIDQSVINAHNLSIFI